MKAWRIYLILCFLLLLFTALIGRLFYLQIIQNSLYKALSQGQQGQQVLQGQRGKIFFAGGQLLATSLKEKYVFLLPQKIEKKDEVIKSLANVLSLNEEIVKNKLSESESFIVLKENISEKEAKDVKDLKLQGVYVDEAIFREYPQEKTASKVVGFLGGEEQGQYGIEGYYNSTLQAKETLKENSGADIFLTLDYNIQAKAEKLLKGAKDNLNIKSGQIIVLEPSTGKILALADYPNFDPNNYSEEKNFSIFQNSTVQKLYEPGSIFKPITMASALDQGKITPQTKYQDKGSVKIGGYTIYNYAERNYGENTMTQVLEKSINTGAVFAQSQISHQSFLDYIQRFGLFEKTGIDLQGEVYSENKELKKGYEINYATASFGQGIQITPMQMVRAFSAIANNGRLVKPYIVDKIFNTTEIVEKKPEISSQAIISQKTVSQLTAMMVSVIENGFSKKAKIPHYYLAGKTGTAQIPFEDKKGYSDKTWQSFIGFGPALNPRFLILIKLDEPEAKTAEYSALPMFRELAKYIIDYLEIPPDYE